MKITHNSKERILNIWWHKDERTITIRDFRLIRKRNREDYPHDEDINNKRIWGTSTNGAVKGVDSCLDWTLSLGHIEFNYINWTYNKKK